jgi:beta-phosphoglucomutase-like phosphatase (HAD superfamily)
VGTNAERANVDFVLREGSLRKFFRVAVDGQQVANPKPHPDVYLRAAELLGVPPAHCVVFEDSHGGVAAGLAAGMRVVGITTTYAQLPGTSVLAQNFDDPALEAWLVKEGCEPAAALS